MSCRSVDDVLYYCAAHNDNEGEEEVEDGVEMMEGRLPWSESELINLPFANYIPRDQGINFN